MNVHESSETLGVHLMSGDEIVRVGELVRATDGMSRFHIDEAYIALAERPILSSCLLRPGDRDQTDSLLRDSTHLKGGRGIPAWFENLLPEGALRTHIEADTGRMADFDLLRQLGCDLPGAVVVTDESARQHTVETASRKDIRFSIAGVQSKLSMLRTSDGYDLLDGGIGGNTVVKLPNPKIPSLPEVEYASMLLAASVGVDTAHVELVPLDRLHGVPDELREENGSALAIERFDRTPSGVRIHIEDFNQILGVAVDRKYSAANDETVLKMAGLFGSGQGCFLQACRRAAVNILVGNTDAHLKNWSIWYPDPLVGKLSPAYDIVAGAVYDHSDEMALRFRRTRNAAIMDIARFERAASFAGFASSDVRDEIGRIVEKAADTWGSMLRDLPMPDTYAKYLLQRTQRLALAQEFGCEFRPLSGFSAG
ncbi:type II toxin-antitoxin system HipA family toxin [Agrobacterium rubi]|nr:type II toxin-antitoxin system HipA family toxin [Agrobacterium rubi]NTF25118.1 type II toxin-antitoxin system HipA family toxin [Agrobacterium rubi]